MQIVAHQSANPDSAVIRVKSLRKCYPSSLTGGEKIEVFESLDLSVQTGEFITVFGPNGCGKSTLLHILAGLIKFDSGTILIDKSTPDAASLGFVFQNFTSTLFPWKNAMDNIAFPLELAGLGLEERRAKVGNFVQAMGINLPMDAYPYKLSGGQQQLVSIARALVMEPKVLLMDEPFNQLDYQARIHMQSKTLDLWHSTKTTVLFVSHDIDEALLLGKRIFFLSKRPSRIIHVLENPLPYPRRHEMLFSKDFFDLRERAISMFGSLILN
jgi:NitT/TauT family transport system ATP-binding protein